eukprot:6448976-Pyramimonas_sp.AAC.1
MVCLIAPIINDSDVQDSQKLGSVRHGARSGAQDLSVLGPLAKPVVLEGKYRSSVDTREPRNPTKREEYQKHLQGVLYILWTEETP